MTTRFRAAASEMSGLAELRRVIADEVVEPDPPGYEAVRRPAMARFRHVRPRAVVRCGR